MDSLSCAFEKRRRLLSKEDMGFTVYNNQRLEDSTDERNKDSGKSIPLFSSNIKTSTLIQFDTRTPSSATKSNKEKLAQTSLEIKNVGADQFPLGKTVFSSPSVSAKRSSPNSELLIPVCQVHGCNKDLSFSKNYHKRHKVCDIHSKTSVVVVSGIQQRFCQQCSRFHMVAEFDGGKRSCRRRLAGHNERRRKPQLLTQFGSNSAHRDFSRTSLFFPKILPTGGWFGQDCYEPTKTVPQLAVPTQFGFSLHLHNFVKKCPFDNHIHKGPLFVPNFSNYGSALSLLSSLSRERINQFIGSSSDH